MSLAATLALSGCNGSDTAQETIPAPAPSPVIYSYEVDVVNLTEGQPMSPMAVILHNDGMLWEIGEAASAGLEKLAESGDNLAILADSIVLSGKSGTGVVLPGASDKIMVSISNTLPMKFSLATMLVNTNDGFTGVNAMDISALMVGDSMTVTTHTYDAGTESNSELMATIPGPAAGGEGFNSERDDIDKITVHAGIVSKDDGLMQSVLTPANRFDNPTLMVTITRIK